MRFTVKRQKKVFAQGIFLKYKCPHETLSFQVNFWIDRQDKWTYGQTDNSKTICHRSIDMGE